MMKKKGFTLIELLAVIVVLAIIALIAVPLVLNSVETSRKASFKDSIINASGEIDYYLLKNNLKELGIDGVDLSELALKNNNLSGKFVPVGNKIYANMITNGKYCANGEIDNLEISNDCVSLDKSPAEVDWEKVKIVVTTNSITVTLEDNFAIDNESGIKNYTIELSGIDNGKKEKRILSSVGTESFNKLESGSYEIEIKVINNNNEITERKFAVELASLCNGEKPTFSISPQGFSTEKFLSINGSCEGLEVSYAFVENNSVGPFTKYEGKGLNLTENKSIIARVTDGTNYHQSRVQTITGIDRTAPELTVSYTKTTKSITLIANGKDEESEISEYQYSEDAGRTWEKFNEGSNSVTFTDLNTGTYNYLVRAINGTYPNSQLNEELNVTTVPVSVQLSPVCDGNSPTIEVKPNGYANSKKASVTVPEDCNKYDLLYSIDAVSWHKYTNEITFENNGYIIATVTDGINYLEYSSATIQEIDRTAPDLSLAYANKTTNSVVVVASGNDDESGIIGYKYKIDNEIWTDLTESNNYKFEKLKTGSHTIKVKAYNGTYNTDTNEENSMNYTEKSIEVVIDNVCGGQPPKIEVTPTGWQQSKKATITLPENCSNVIIKYKKNNEEWANYTSPITFEESGTLIASVTDGVNYVTSASTTVTEIDVEAPVVEISNIAETWVQTDDIILTLKDSQSGIKEYNVTSQDVEPDTWISVENTPKEINKLYRLTASGTYYAWVKDISGRIGKIQFTHNKIDDTDPEIIITGISDEWINEDEIQFTFVDEQSGIDGWKVTKTETSPATYENDSPAMWTAKTNGTYYVHVKDKSGRISHKKFVIEKVDDEKPSATISGISSTWTDKDEVTITLEDNKSGVVAWVVTSTTDEPSTSDWNNISNTKTSTQKYTAIESGTFYAHVKDAVGNTNYKEFKIDHVDSTDPDVLTAAVTTLGTNNAQISITAKDKDSGIKNVVCEYGETTSYGNQKTVSIDSDGNGNCTLTGLKTNTKYYYRIKATNNANKSAIVVSNFTTGTSKITTSVEPNNWQRSKTVNVSYTSALITNPTYFVKTTVDTTINEKIYKCSENENYQPTNCSSAAETNNVMIANTWYRTSNTITVKFEKDGALIATMTDGLTFKDNVTQTITQIDATSPSMLSLTVDSDNWTTEKELTGSAIDNESGIVAYQFSTNANITTLDSGWTEIAATKTATSHTKKISSNGTWYYYVKDQAGNISKNSISIEKIDTDSPVAEIEELSTIWVTDDTVKITLKDSQSGVVAWKVATTSITPLSWNDINKSNETSFDYTIDRNGTYYIHVKDESGRTSYKEFTVSLIDDTEPEITVSGIEKNSWVISDEVTFNLKDSQSGVAKWAVSQSSNIASINAGAWNDVSPVSRDSSVNYTANSNGTYYVHVKDLVGNSSYTSFTIYKIDETDPVINSSVTKIGTTNVEISITATDNETGINSVTCKVGTGLNGNYTITKSILIDSSGVGKCELSELKNETIYHYLIEATDKVGNSTSKFDTFETGNSNISFEIDKNGWQKSKIATTTFTASKVTSPSYYIYPTVSVKSNVDAYACGNGDEPSSCGTSSTKDLTKNTWYKISSPVALTFKEDGAYIAAIFDGYKYIRSEAQNLVQIDSSLPEIISLDKNTNNWGNNVTLTAKSKDTLSGIKYYIFTTNSNLTAVNSDWSSLTSSETTQLTHSSIITSNGTWYYYAADEAGNISKSEIKVENIDSSDPTISVSGISTSWTVSDEVTLTLKDSQSGVASYAVTTEKQVTINDWINLDNVSNNVIKNVTLTSNGTYYAYVKDATGKTNSIEFKIDHIDDGNPSVEISNISTSWVASDDITFKFKDSQSGVKAYAIINGTGQPTASDWHEYSSASAEKTENINITQNSKNYYVWVKDAVGKTASKNFEVNYIDTNNPSLTAPVTKIGLNSATISINAEDTESGINTVTCEYGETSSYGGTSSSLSLNNTTSGKSGSCTLSGLKENTTYYYRVITYDKIGKGAIVTSTFKTGQSKITPSVSPTGWQKSKDLTLTYTISDVTNPEYYFKSDVNTTSNINMKSCGTGSIPGDCSSTATTNIIANTWYQSSTNSPLITYTTSGTYIGAIYDGYNYVQGVSGTIAEIDTTAPNITSLVVNTENWATMKTITATVNDSESGISKYLISTNSDLNASSIGWYTTTNTKEPVELSSTVHGNATWYFYVQDLARNISKQSIYVDKIDTTGPEITISITGEAYDSGYKSGAVATVSCKDPESGIISGEKDVTLTSAGKNTVSGTCTNGANSTSSDSKDYTIYVYSQSNSCTHYDCLPGTYNTCVAGYVCPSGYPNGGGASNTCTTSTSAKSSSCLTGSNTCVAGYKCASGYTGGGSSNKCTKSTSIASKSNCSSTKKTCVAGYVCSTGNLTGTSCFLAAKATASKTSSVSSTTCTVKTANLSCTTSNGGATDYTCTKVITATDHKCQNDTSLNPYHYSNSYTTASTCKTYCSNQGYGYVFSSSANYKCKCYLPAYVSSSYTTSACTATTKKDCGYTKLSNIGSSYRTCSTKYTKTTYTCHVSYSCSSSGWTVSGSSCKISAKSSSCKTQEDTCVAGYVCPSTYPTGGGASNTCTTSVTIAKKTDCSSGSNDCKPGYYCPTGYNLANSTSTSCVKSTSVATKSDCSSGTNTCVPVCWHA